ncbi:MAG TPA: hypothetical protein VJN72_00550 [Gaiellales bacterium]|nr:hypothetical protein [Gaiellales bacterium]
MPANEAIIIELRLAGATQFQTQARAAAGSLEGIGSAGAKAEKPTGKMAGVLKKVGPLAAGAAVGGGLMAAKFGVDAVKAFRESWKIGQQTSSVIKSTGGAANVTAAQVGNLATSISNKTGIDDETIQSGENMLLTFTRLRNESGKGNDVFNQATRTLTDMSTALGSDPQQQAVQLGKALNDPVKGISALSRVGVTFDANQKKRIKRFVDEGKTVKAQRVILKELNKEFGGSAKAQATNADRLKVAFGNLQENVGKLLAPALEKVSGLMLKLGPLFSHGGAGLRVLHQALQAMQPIFDAAAAAARNVVWAFRPLVQNAHYLVPVLKILATVVGAVLVVALRIFAVEMRVVGRYVRILIGAIKVLVTWVRAIIGAARSAAGALGRLASTVRTAVSGAFRTAVSRAKSLVEGFKRLGGQIVRAIADGIKSAPGAILDAIKSIIPGGKIGGAVKKVFGFQHGGTVMPHQRVQLVGERGPELATFRPGTRITPLTSNPLPRLSAAAGAGPGRGEIVVPVILNGREIARAVAQDTADQRARRGGW